MGFAVVYWHALESMEFFKTLGKSTTEHKKMFGGFWVLDGQQKARRLPAENQ